MDWILLRCPLTCLKYLLVGRWECDLREGQDVDVWEGLRGRGLLSGWRVLPRILLPIWVLELLEGTERVARGQDSYHQPPTSCFACMPPERGNAIPQCLASGSREASLILKASMSHHTLSLHLPPPLLPAHQAGAVTSDIPHLEPDISPFATQAGEEKEDEGQETRTGDQDHGIGRSQRDPALRETWGRQKQLLEAIQCLRLTRGSTDEQIQPPLSWGLYVQGPSTGMQLPLEWNLGVADTGTPHPMWRCYAYLQIHRQREFKRMDNYAYKLMMRLDVTVDIWTHRTPGFFSYFASSSLCNFEHIPTPRTKVTTLGTGPVLDPNSLPRTRAQTPYQPPPPPGAEPNPL